MAMVATTYLSDLTSRVAFGWLNDDGARRHRLATGSVGMVWRLGSWLPGPHHCPRRPLPSVDADGDGGYILP